MRKKLNKKLKLALATLGAFAVCGVSAYSFMNEPIESCADSTPVYEWVSDLTTGSDEVYSFDVGFYIDDWGEMTPMSDTASMDSYIKVDNEHFDFWFMASISDGYLSGHVDGSADDGGYGFLTYLINGDAGLILQCEYGSTYYRFHIGTCYTQHFAVVDTELDVYGLNIYCVDYVAPHHITSGQRGLLSWSVDFDGEDYVGTFDFRIRFYPIGGDFDFDRALVNCSIRFKGGFGGATNATLKNFTSSDSDTSFTYFYDDALGWVTLSMHSVDTVDPDDEESDVLWDWTTVVHSYHVTLGFGQNTTPAYLDCYSPDNVLALYAVNDHATTYDLSLYAPFYGAGDDAVIDIVSILTAGIVNLGTGIGQGVSSFVQSLAFNSAGDGLSVYFVMVCVFGGIALAVGLTSKVYIWLSNLGS